MDVTKGFSHGQMVPDCRLLLGDHVLLQVPKRTLRTVSNCHQCSMALAHAATEYGWLHCAQTDC